MSGNLEPMAEIQARVDEAKQFQFLRRVHDVVDGHAERFVPSGDLGTALGLPYEEALRIVEALDAGGLVERVGEMVPPHGPRVHLTRRGIAAVREHAA